jgi:colanic acid biosynthesis glycosyl transferase WcaI
MSLHCAPVKGGECVKIVFLNRYFHPDHSATSQMLSDLAFCLAGRGYAVHVITSRQRYADAAAALPATEAVHGVSVHRVWTTRFGRARLFGRAIDYLTFYFSAALRLARLIGKGDIVVAKTDPPLISVPAALVAWLRGARLINWLQDIFPETAERLGFRFACGPVGRVIRGLRNLSLRAAGTNVVLGERMRAVVEGFAPGTTEVIHNWADGSAVRPVNPESNPLRNAWGLAGKFVVGYSGNMGRVHEFETVLGACERLRNEPGTTFLFIGDGSQRAWLQGEVQRRGLAHVLLFQPYQPRSALAESLSAVDVHLVSLQPELEGLIVPSKFYGIVAAGRPVIFVGERDGEIARLIAAHGCGMTVPVGESAALAAAVRALKEHPARVAQMGNAARQLLETRFDAQVAMARWEAVLARSGGLQA